LKKKNKAFIKEEAMAIQKNELEKIVGQGNVLDDEQTLTDYSRDQSFVNPRKPDMVVFVETVEQIQDIVKLANTTSTPVIPFSSGKNLHGATIPDHGGIILNMSKMKKILRIDEDNWFVIVEPGVTYRELQEMLIEKGYRMMVPFGIVPERSVLTSYLERDPVLAAPSFETGNSLIMDTELILPNGELFRTGNWATGGEPGAPNGPIRNNVYRLWTGSQGTLGILTKMALQIEPIPKARKIFFLPFQQLADAIEPLKRIQKRELGTECLLLNSFNLAAMFTEDWDIPESIPTDQVPSEEFDQMRNIVPPWTLIISLNGHLRRPEEKIAYEEEALRELCDVLNIEILENIPNVPGAAAAIEREILRPWKILKKFNYKGSVHDLTFKAPLKKVTEIEKIMQDLAHRHDYANKDIGMYLLPLERGRAIHCEFDLHCRPSDQSEWDGVHELWLKSSEELMRGGAYFDKPYGAWAEMVYSRASNYTIMLKKLKSEIDPNNVLNPGKLCFSQ
jgi:FAD/FMN-containing dehydrogenase